MYYLRHHKIDTLDRVSMVLSFLKIFIYMCLFFVCFRKTTEDETPGNTGRRVREYMYM